VFGTCHSEESSYSPASQIRREDSYRILQESASSDSGSSAWLSLLEATLVHHGEIESPVLRSVPPGLAIMCGILNRS
jgi:hypothetical protein